MTGAQKRWLDAHPEYEAIGVAGGHVGHDRRGTLYPDGTFKLAGKAAPIQTSGGAFGVGVRVIREPGKIADPRAETTSRKV